MCQLRSIMSQVELQSEWRADHNRHLGNLEEHGDDYFGALLPV